MVADTKQCLSSKVEEGATGIHYFKNDEKMEITTADKTLMSKIRRIASKSEEVIIDAEPSINNGGFMLALVPAKYLSFKLPRSRNMTDEQKQAARERMKNIRSKLINKA